MRSYIHIKDVEVVNDLHRKKIGDRRNANATKDVQLDKIRNE